MQRLRGDRAAASGFAWRALAGCLAASVGLAAVRAQEPDGEWRMAARDYANLRYSPLGQITKDNAKNLQVAWTFSAGIVRGHEAAPLVVGDTMYVVTPYPNTLYALDLKQAGAVKWRYDPQVSSSAQGVACCDVVNRGAAGEQRALFMARMGVLSSVFFVLVIVAQGLPNFLLDPCQR
ncbi:Pyrrolo-quinoline quinone [Opitutus terrae PB90-1]|uniref:Pyrrolo-quinoline quinone n=2 Tax=Opitutus terrae TaxID=107709 RepID=B2A076_OPITP|nr:Pyrrolo-quinoline quinone [Opitutus terrae PB90-1]